MDPAKLPPISRRLDFVIQAMEDICTRLDRIAESLMSLQQRAAESVAPRALMSIKEAAAALGVSVGTMRSLAGREIPYVKIGRRTSFVPNDLERFVAKNRRDWGSSRWMGKGRHRYGDQQKYDDAYLERLNRPDPSEKMPPLDDAFTEALKANDVNLNARRALRLAGINSIEKARSFSVEEILRLKGLGFTLGPRVLRAIGKSGRIRRRSDGTLGLRPASDTASAPPGAATQAPPPSQAT